MIDLGNLHCVRVRVNADEDDDEATLLVGAGHWAGNACGACRFLYHRVRHRAGAGGLGAAGGGPPITLRAGRLAAVRRGRLGPGSPRSRLVGPSGGKRGRRYHHAQGRQRRGRRRGRGLRPGRASPLGREHWRRWLHGDPARQRRGVYHRLPREGPRQGDPRHVPRLPWQAHRQKPGGASGRRGAGRGGRAHGGTSPLRESLPGGVDGAGDPTCTRRVRAR